MENINYGVNPNDGNDEMPDIMKEIEKNIREQEGNTDIDTDIDTDTNSDTDTDTNADTDANADANTDVNTDVNSNTDIDTNNAADSDGGLKEPLPEEVIEESELFREKYKTEKKKRKSALADRQRLEQENHYLKTHLNGAVENSAKLYGRDLYNDLEKIKNIKKQALLGDDPDLLIEADELYQTALYKVNEYEGYLNDKDSSNVNGNDDQSNNTNYEEQVKLSAGQEWINEHPELIEDSYKYNPKIQKELGSFIEQFDRELILKGREDEILTEPYLNVLEEFIDNVKVNKSENGYTTSKVGGVRNNFSNGDSGRMKVTLTAFDKNYARNLGITEKEYLKYKIEDIKESKKKGK